MAELLEINLAAKKIVVAAPVPAGEYNGNGYLTLPLVKEKKYVTREGDVVLAPSWSSAYAVGTPEERFVFEYADGGIHGWNDIKTGRFTGLPVDDKRGIVRDYISDVHTAWLNGAVPQIRYTEQGNWMDCWRYTPLLPHVSNDKKKADEWYRAKLLHLETLGNARIKPE